MQERTTPSPVVIDESLSINDLLAQRLERDAGGTLAERADEHGHWTPVSVQAFADEVRAVAKGLVALGIAPGDRVGIMSRTRYEWTVLDFAGWAAGAVVVPIYETSSAEQVRWIASDSGVRLVVVETTAHAAVVEEARDDLPGLGQVLVIDSGAIGALETLGATVDDEEIDRRSAALTGADLATVIYTSGTTGRPKGAELTHGNFVALTLLGVDGLADVCAAPGSRTLIFLPLAHVFARFIEVLCIPSGAVMGHAPDVKHLVEDLGAFRPTFVLAVPRVFEKVYNSAQLKAGGGARLRAFRWSAKVAITWSRALDTPGGPSAVLRAQHRVADALVLNKLRAALGGHARYAISGGAPLGERLAHFYRGIGVVVLEGYGLTETTAPTAVNLPELVKIGTVGPPFPGTSIRIAEDGEIQVSGPHVFRGYRHLEEATAEAFDDGWFRTGDIGRLDDDGYLQITGRKKEIIVTAGGKNVAPAVLEDRLRAHPLVSQVVVVGDQRPFVGALVTLDEEMLPGWLTQHGLPPMSPAEARTNPDVLAALDRAVTRANDAVSHAESIRKIELLDTDLTEENGYLTPSLKVKRALVVKDFADAIERLYTDTRGTTGR